jgi:hypothetical protein
VTGEEERIQAWLEHARAQSRTRQGIRAIGSLRLDSPEGSGRVKQVILAERPARLRLESLSILGHTQTLLVTDGESFWFYDGEQFSGGAVTPDVLRRYLGLDLAPREAVGMIMGTPFSDEEPRPVTLEILGLGEDRIVDLPDRRLRFGPDGDLLGVEVSDRLGRTRWRAEYSGWREVSGGRYPFQVVLHFPLTELRARLDLQEVELNPSLDPSLFRVPVGARE